MIQLEKQTCTIEQALKLKELGVKQESLFYWQYGELRYGQIESAFCDDKIMRCSVCYDDLNISGTEIYCQCSKWTATEPMDPWKWGGFANGKLIPYSAFTCAELGVMLPLHQFTYPQSGGTFTCCDYTVEDGIIPSGVTPTCYKTEAEARAAMLIHLLESKLITVEEINSKL